MLTAIWVPPVIGPSEERWCQTVGKNTAQCQWRRRHGFEVPLPPRHVPGWPPPETYLSGGELGVDIPGLDTMATVGKTIYYVGVGTALIAGALFVWKVSDALFGD